MITKGISFKDSNIYYNYWENSGKETIVFLHSFGSSLKLFSEQVKYLKAEYQLLLIDLPGHGKSGFSYQVTFKDGPEIIKTILNQYHLSKVHLFGVKEGALIAQAFANIYPNNTLSLILMSTYSLFFNTYKTVKSATRKANFLQAFKWLFCFNKYQQELISKSALSSEGQNFFKETMTNFKRKTIFTKRGMKRFYQLDFKENMYPIYLLCGKEDKEVIKDASLQFEQKYNYVILEGYPDSREIVFLDKARLFKERILTFLKEIRGK